MTDPSLLLASASAGLIAVAMASAAGLRGWREWLAVRRLRLSEPRQATASPLRELRERVRKLEAIASGEA